MKINMTKNITRLYVFTGTAAIILGGVISAFSAKQPSTLAMWSSAYLVLVAGVAQVFFGLGLEVMTTKQQEKSLRQSFGLFNLGNLLVISGSVVKYANWSYNMHLTTLGSTSLIVGLAMLWQAVKLAPPSQLKTVYHTAIALLVACVPIGIFLAQLR